MAAQRKPTRDDARRGGQLAKIHIAKSWAVKTLGMAGGDYRALVGDVMSEFRHENGYRRFALGAATAFADLTR